MFRAPTCVLLLLVASFGTAQQAPVFELRHYGPEEGLSNRHTTALAQDDIGYIWIGSVSGLDRFDGHSFRNWSVSDGLTGGRVDALRRDPDGIIWVFSSSAANDIVTIDLMDPAVGSLRPLTVRHEELPFNADELIRVGPQRFDGKILLGARSPARCILYNGDGRFKVIPLKGERFEPVGMDRMGEMIGHLVGEDGHQDVVRVDTLGEVEVLRELARGTVVEAMVSGRDTPGALYKTTLSGGQPLYYDTYSELQFSQAPQTRVGSPQGDPIYKPMSFTPLPRHGSKVLDTRILGPDDTVLYDLTAVRPEVGGRVKDCLVDRSGDPWLATEFGLFSIAIRGEAFERLLYTEHIPEGMGLLCRGMVWDNDRLYLSTEWEGAYALTLDSTGARAQRRQGSPYLFATYVQDDGTWWRGGPQVVEREDPQGKLRRFSVADKIWSILAISDRSVLLGGLEGLHELDPVDGTVTAWGRGDDHPELAHAHVMQLHRLADGDIQAVTSKGLYRFDAEGHIRERSWSGAEPPRRLPYDDLHHCYTDPDGIQWLSTRGAGLVRHDPTTGQDQQYTMRNGFPNNMVYAAYEDANDQLWLPTDGGIVRFDKRTRQSTVFTTADGITHDEFNRLAHAQAPDGRLFFGGMNGITAFDPEDFRSTRDEAEHPLVLTGFMRYSTEHGGMVDRTAEVVHGAPIELEEHDRSIHISFALLTFEGTGRILYAWRLAGVEDEWNYQHAASVRLDRLPYGTHVLEVKARDAMGQWSQHMLEVPITVHMPWTAGRWPWVAVGILLAGVALTLALLIRGMRRSRVRSLVAEPSLA